MGKVFNIVYASSLTDLCEINSSFDKGILRICYTGKNRNGSFISKDALKKSLPTIYNCPIVCNYDRETGTLGGHDMEVVREADGELRLVNMTTPLGVIPESANVWMDEFEEEDGTIHEYLYAEALLWKRQEAYRKIKADGITAHSMEITVKDGERVDGVYNINDFEFTAFALIGVEPCFESSALEMFSQQDFKQQFAEMMRDIKESFAKVNPPDSEGDDIKPQNYSMEGGERVLEEKMELAAKYGIDVESLEFSLDDLTLEELEEKFKAMQEGSGTEPKEEGFALTGNIVEELDRVLCAEKLQREWGECTRYWYVDCDFEAGEVYCWDCNDWLLYGFPYAMDGDSITVDFACRKRKKYVIEDFDEGSQTATFPQIFAEIEQKLCDNAGWEAKYQTASDTIESMEKELGELRQFKSDAESATARSERYDVFARFDDLAGLEAFEALRENCMDLTVEALEEKCYAIRGRNGTAAKFALEGKTPKLKVEKTDVSNEPYGGIFAKYGIGSDR